MVSGAALRRGWAEAGAKEHFYDEVLTFRTSRQEARRQVFSVDVRPVARAAVLRLRGELDFDSVGQLYEAADTALSMRPVPELVVADCSTLEFCDSSGIGGLIRLYQRLSAEGGQLRLAAVPPSVARVFMLTGLEQAIPVHASPELALLSGGRGHDSLTGDRADAVVQGAREK